MCAESNDWLKVVTQLFTRWWNRPTDVEKERLEYFVSLNKTEFTRKDYMDIFKDISSATASRDLKKGAELDLFDKIGEKNKTIFVYPFNVHLLRC
jgi:Fic family protein